MQTHASATARMPLDHLWARISERGAFPVLSDTLRATMAALKSDDLDYHALARIILSDVALTQKVLRLANSAMYAAFGGNITTVTRALMVLGIDTVAHLVVGSKLLDHFEQSSRNHTDAKLALNRALLAGTIARKLTAHANLLAGEEALVCTLMQQVGKLLVVCYLETEWQQIRVDTAQGCDEEQACKSLLGVNFETIGLDAARRWQLPETILDGMMRYDAATHAADIYPLAPAEDPAARPGCMQWLRAVSSCSTEMTDALVADDPGAGNLAPLAERYGPVLGVTPETLAEIAATLLREEASDAVRREIVALREQSQALAGGGCKAELSSELAAVRAMPPERTLESALAHVAENMLSGLGLSRVVGFVRDANQVFSARLARGSWLPAQLTALRFKQMFEPDVFHLAIGNTIGIYIEDAQSPRMVQRAPEWYRRTLGDACAYLLLPVHVRGEAVALLYGDWLTRQAAHKIRPDEMELLNALSAELGRFYTSDTAPA